MKSFKCLCTLLLACGLLCASSYADAQENNNDCTKCCQCQNTCPTNCENKGFSFELGYIFWQTHLAQLPFSGDIISNPFGATIGGVTVETESHQINITDNEHDWDHGFRIAVGYGCCQDWEVIGRYTYFSASGSKSLGDASVDSGAIYANLHDRSLADNAGLNTEFDDGKVDFASEKLSLQLHIADIEYQNTCKYCNYSMTYSGGIRFASIDQERNVLYINEEPVADRDTYTIDMDSEMRGFGLRAGSEFYYPFGCEGLSFYGRGALSILLGEFDVDRRDEAFNASEPDIEIRSYRHDYYALIPVLELGIGFDFFKNNWKIQIGYEFINWANMFQHIDFPGWDNSDDETAQTRITTGNLSFDGLFVTIKKYF